MDWSILNLRNSFQINYFSLKLRYDSALKPVYTSMSKRWQNGNAATTLLFLLFFFYYYTDVNVLKKPRSHSVSLQQITPGTNMAERELFWITSLCVMLQNINEVSITGHVKILICWAFKIYRKSKSQYWNKIWYSSYFWLILFMKIAVATFIVCRNNKCQDQNKLLTSDLCII
jgi:hypothetical protein